jgi:NADH-quinone oxidoreductase subunit G
MPECNSFGTGLLGGRNLAEAFSSVRDGRVDTVIILENDLYRRSDQKAVDDFLNRAGHLIVIDHLINATSSRADIVLSAATFAESMGTLVNAEGRAQRYYQVFDPDIDIQASWKWFDDIMKSTRNAEVDKHQSFDGLINKMASALPILAPMNNMAPPADFRIQGLKIPRQPHRYSGRTSMLADVSLHEPKPPQDPDSPLSFSMEGYEGRPPAPLIPRYWSPGWNSVQALNKFQQEVAGPLCGGDPGKRLIEPVSAGKPTYFGDIPQAGKKEYSTSDFPHYAIFGSEELSSYAPSIVEREKLGKQGNT